MSMFLCAFFRQMVAANVCVWLAVLIGETRHELELSLSDPYRVTPLGFEDHPYPLGLRAAANATNNASALVGANVHNKPLHTYMDQAAAAVGSTLMEPYPRSCRAQTIIGNILQKVRNFFSNFFQYEIIWKK